MTLPATLDRLFGFDLACLPPQILFDFYLPKVQIYLDNILNFFPRCTKATIRGGVFFLLLFFYPFLEESHV